MVCVYDGILLSHQKKQNWIICSDVGERTVCHIELSLKDKNKYCILMHIYEIQKNGTDKPICRAEIKMQTYRTDLWIEWGKERVE